MQNEVNHTTLLSMIPEAEDFSSLLAGYGILSRANPPYLEAGEPAQTQGWILHLSVIPVQYKGLLTDILPELLVFRVPFKIVATQKLLRQFNNGLFGNQKVGKAITIFIEDGLDLPAFLEALLSKTGHYTGPRISTDYRFRHNLYYRYGSFKPVIYTDGYGNRERLMYDQAGNLMKDVYSDPPLLPNWLENPFARYQQTENQDAIQIPAVSPTGISGITRAPGVQGQSMFAAGFFAKYRPVQLLKSDKKGDVYKGIYYRHHLLPTWCIIKQGRMGQFADETGADMQNRILWQYQVMQELENTLRIPHVLAKLEDKEQNFLVMSLVDGEPLAKKTFTILHNRPWWLVSRKEQNEITGYLLQVTQQIQALHQKGYIHRDITGTNFLVTPGGKVYLVDLELVYHYPTRQPWLPYQQGTPGYMSPQQWKYEVPQPADDTYALGALLLNCLTGIEPVLLLQEKNSDPVSHLFFFFRDAEWVTFLGKCLHKNPAERPGFFQIITFLEKKRQFSENLTCHGFNEIFVTKTTTKQGQNRANVKGIITQYICTLSGNLLSYEGLWFSHLNNPYDTGIYPLNNKAFYGALYRGVGGPLYFLSDARRVGFDTRSAEANSQIAWQLIQKNILDNNSHTAPGLYFGSSGIAVLLAKNIQNGILPANDHYLEAISQCLDKESPLLDVIHGITGDGLAILLCSGFLTQEKEHSLLEKIIHQLENSQQKDGSWLLPGQDNRPEKIAGFGYGIAGIVYLLLEYSHRYRQAHSLQVAERGLDYLTRQSIKRKDHYEWENSNRTKQTGVWWCHGGPGITLTFLKAHEITGNHRYLHFAEQALRINPKELTTHQISLCHGAAGLGEIYLEAWRVTQNEEWRERAGRIVDLLLALKQEKTTGEIYWNTEQKEFPTADLMTGSSGMTHFLLRWLYPERISFPLLPEPESCNIDHLIQFDKIKNYEAYMI
jgi:serine/threonine protein kinase